MMIDEKRAKTYCCEDISLIENYELAVNDETQTWHCHHRGEILPCGRYTPEDLKKFNLYYSRPANELIFLTQYDHRSLHHKSKHYSEEVRKKISATLKGQHHSEDTRKKMSEAHKGKHHSEETRRKLAAARKGRIWWNNGIKNAMAFECPGPEWQKGRLKKKGS